MNIKIFTGVPIYTLSDKKPKVQSVVVSNGNIIFTGDFNEARGKYSYSEVIELSGGALIPGFIEPRINLKSFSNIFRDLDLSNVTNVEELLEILKSYINRVKSKRENWWVIGGGLKPDFDRLITRIELDSVAPNNPVLLYMENLHNAIVNSKALEVSGIDKSIKNPMGGIIEKNSKGELTGILRERAIDIVLKFVDFENTKKTLKSYQSGIKKLVESGITTICDFSGDSNESKLNHASIIMQLYRNSQLKNRIMLMMDEDKADLLRRLGFGSNFGSEYLYIGGVNIQLDGTLQAMTAYLKKVYSKNKSNGVLMYEEEELYKIIRSLYKNYIWTAIKATGDAANEIALNIYSRLGKEKAIPQLPKRIDYAELLTDEEIESFPYSNVIAVMNPSHIPYIRKRAIEILSVDAKNLFRIASLINSGVKVAFASDAPVVYPDPLHSIYCAVERKDYNDGPELRFYPREHINVVEAIKSVTINAARSIGLDNIIGSIEVGKKADMVLLSRDIFQCKTDDFKDIQVLKTFVGGEDVNDQ